DDSEVRRHRTWIAHQPQVLSTTGRRLDGSERTAHRIQFHCADTNGISVGSRKRKRRSYGSNRTRSSLFLISSPLKPISKTLCRFFSPEMSSTAERGTSSTFERNSTAALLALPSSAGAFNLKISSSSRYPPNCVFRAFGMTRTFRRLKRDHRTMPF